MVSDNAEEQNKTDRKASTPKPKVFAHFNSVIDTSCTKLNELFSCQKVAHSFVFYVIIFILLFVLVYIFRKLVSLPNGNSRYHGRKHNTSTASEGSRNSNNDSFQIGFPTKWLKLTTGLKNVPTNIPGSTDLNSTNEKKSRIYGVPGNGWQTYSNNQANLKAGKNTYYNSYGHLNDFRPNRPTINSYSSSSNGNGPKANQESIKKNTSNNLNRANWLTPSLIGNSEYGNEPSESSSTGILSSGGATTIQNDWSSQNNIGNSGLTPPDSNWEYSWRNKPWDVNSNLRPWTYSGSSGTGLTKIVQKPQQDARSNKQNIPSTTPRVTNYGTWDPTSWSSAKWDQPGSGFNWIKTTDNDKADSYRSTTTPNSNDYYYDNMSGKWSLDGYPYSNVQSSHNIERSNSYLTDSNEVSSPFSWNPYAENWSANQTHDWGNFNYPNRNSAAGISSQTGEESNLWNHQASFLNNAVSENIRPSEDASNPVQQDDNDERINRWPLEDGYEEEPLKNGRTVFTSNKRHFFKRPGKRNRKVTIPKKGRISQHKRKKKVNKKYYKYNDKKYNKARKAFKFNRNVKKSMITHPSKVKSTQEASRKNSKVIIRKKIKKKLGKHFFRKVK